MSAEKTEQASPKRLREARDKGDVCRSQEIPSALGILILAGYFAFWGADIFSDLKNMLNFTLQNFYLPFDQALDIIWSGVVYIAFFVLAPILAIVMVSALIGNITQVGFLISMQSITPKLANLNPTKWFKKVFSLKNFVELIKNILKVVVLGYLIWRIMEGNLPVLLLLGQSDLGALLTMLGVMARDLILSTAIAFCAIAMLDFLFQKWQYAKDHRMTKDEVKREFKEMEGDPNIKGKRKQMYKELVAQNSLDSVRRAKVLVTNPTHYAIALDYEKDKTPLPIILAKGEGMVAKRMIDIAKQEGIPIMHNVPLAHDLFENGVENSYIPKEFILPVAEVLRWAQSLQRK